MKALQTNGLRLYNKVMTEILSTFLDNFNQLNLFIIAASLVLFMAATPICRWLNDDDGLSTRISMMRILNSLIIAGVFADVLLRDYTLLSKLTQSLMVIYFAVIGTQFINFLIRQRFGKVRSSKSKRQISDTYSSRGLSLFVAAVVSVVAIVSCMRILGLNSLLETGGAVGIIGLFLALTQASWAPDIISGLIILNSRMAEEGDVVQFNMGSGNIVASIFKTKVFHTEFLDLANNHRLMVRNAKLRDYGIQNLSRFASAKGLRECLVFNIDYAHSELEVTEMMNRAFAEIDKNEDSREQQFDHEVMVLDTGDHAVTWAVYYYIKNVKQLLKIKQVFRAPILAESMRSNTSLATPSVHINEVLLKQQS